MRSTAMLCTVCLLCTSTREPRRENCGTPCGNWTQPSAYPCSAVTPRTRKSGLCCAVQRQGVHTPPKRTTLFFSVLTVRVAVYTQWQENTHPLVRTKGHASTHRQTARLYQERDGGARDEWKTGEIRQGCCASIGATRATIVAMECHVSARPSECDDANLHAPQSSA